MGVLRLHPHKHMLSEFVEERENEIMNTYLTIMEDFIIIFSSGALRKEKIKNKILTFTKDAMKIII